MSGVLGDVAFCEGEVHCYPVVADGLIPVLVSKASGGFKRSLRPISCWHWSPEWLRFFQQGRCLQYWQICRRLLSKNLLDFSLTLFEYNRRQWFVKDRSNHIKECSLTFSNVQPIPMIMNDVPRFSKLSMLLARTINTQIELLSKHGQCFCMFVHGFQLHAGTPCGWDRILHTSTWLSNEECSGNCQGYSKIWNPILKDGPMARVLICEES